MRAAMSMQVLEHPDMIGGVLAQIPGDEIERRRHELGWSQRELANRSKVAERTVQAAEREHVSDRSYSRIMRAIEDGEAEARAEREPDVLTDTYVIDTPDGPLKVVLSGTLGAMSKADVSALVRRVRGEG